jgi:hypothetical protein
MGGYMTEEIDGKCGAARKEGGGWEPGLLCRTLLLLPLRPQV